MPSMLPPMMMKNSPLRTSKGKVAAHTSTFEIDPTNIQPVTAQSSVQYKLKHKHLSLFAGLPTLVVDTSNTQPPQTTTLPPHTMQEPYLKAQNKLSPQPDLVPAKSQHGKWCKTKKAAKKVIDKVFHRKEQQAAEEKLAEELAACDAGQHKWLDDGLCKRCRVRETDFKMKKKLGVVYKRGTDLKTLENQVQEGEQEQMGMRTLIRNIDDAIESQNDVEISPCPPQIGPLRPVSDLFDNFNAIQDLQDGGIDGTPATTHFETPETHQLWTPMTRTTLPSSPVTDTTPRQYVLELIDSPTFRPGRHSFVAESISVAESDTEEMLTWKNTNPLPIPTESPSFNAHRHGVLFSLITGEDLFYPGKDGFVPESVSVSEDDTEPKLEGSKHHAVEDPNTKDIDEGAKEVDTNTEEEKDVEDVTQRRPFSTVSTWSFNSDDSYEVYEENALADIVTVPRFTVRPRLITIPPRATTTHDPPQLRTSRHETAQHRVRQGDDKKKETNDSDEESGISSHDEFKQVKNGLRQLSSFSPSSMLVDGEVTRVKFLINPPNHPPPPPPFFNLGVYQVQLPDAGVKALLPFPNLEGGMRLHYVPDHELASINDRSLVLYKSTEPTSSVSSLLSERSLDQKFERNWRLEFINFSAHIIGPRKYAQKLIEGLPVPETELDSSETKTTEPGDEVEEEADDQIANEDFEQNLIVYEHPFVVVTHIERWLRRQGFDVDEVLNATADQAKSSGIGIRFEPHFITRLMEMVRRRKDDSDAKSDNSLD